MRASGLLLLAAAALSGCLPVRYVTQAAAGQEELNRHGIAIEELVSGGHLDKRTRGLLAEVAPIKAFGERHGLARTKNYERYVWLGRSAVVWVVSACDPLAFRPYVWRFPIVGSITYTGWFHRDDAKTYAAELAGKGWDVDVRPSDAYSTLGWFDDPVLSTMLSEGDEALGELANVILHETLHATFFVPNQSTLNESVASFFGEHLALAYLDETVGPDSAQKERYVALRARSERRSAVMKQAYEDLARVYESPRPSEQKLAEKQKIVSALRSDLHLKRPVTNATLIQYKTYGSGDAELTELLEQCNGSFPRMLGALERLRKTSAPPHTDPAVLLRPILAEGCR